MVVPLFNDPVLDTWLDVALQQLRDTGRMIQGLDDKLKKFEEMNARVIEQLLNLNETQRLDLIEKNRALQEKERTLEQALEACSLDTAASGPPKETDQDANNTLWFLLTELNFLKLRIAQESDECSTRALQLQINEFQNEIMTVVRKAIPCA